MRTSPAPATQGLPMPRATTAAWLVMPPVEVRMPSAACMPWMSSGLVSRRTRITFSPVRACFSASSAVNTTLPEAAPGDAGKPLGDHLALRPWDRASGCRSWSSEAGTMRATASFLSIRPSRTMSTAILSAALAVRLPLRVCSM